MCPCCRGIRLCSVQVRPYQSAKKGKQIASSTKLGLGENVAQWLMECLTPAFSLDIFMDNYFTFDRHVCSKERLRKCTITEDKELKKNQKNEHGHFEQRTSSKKAV